MNVLCSGLQGLEQAQTQFQRSATALTRPASSPTDTVDLSAQAVSLITAKDQFSAALDLIKVADEMQKSVIDLLA